MFGLTFEKLFVIAIIAAIVIGPQRLPALTRRLAETIRALRGFVESTRARAEDEMGVSLQRADWQSLDLRQYDPRRIVQDALAGSDPVSADPVSPPAPDPATLAEASRIRPGQRFLVTGDSAHPQRILIETLPEDDPRRIAARAEEPVAG